MLSSVFLAGDAMTSDLAIGGHKETGLPKEVPGSNNNAASRHK